MLVLVLSNQQENDKFQECKVRLNVTQSSLLLKPKQWRIQDFPEEGAPTPQGVRQHTILPNFPKNCMKLKEFGSQGGRASLAPPLDPPLQKRTERFSILNKSIFYGYCMNSTYF